MPSPHPRLVAQARIHTPLGPVTAAATSEGLAGLWFDGQAYHPGELDVQEDPSHRWLARLSDELAAYFAGRATFSIPLDLHGTPFQQAVWQALLRIRSGATASYADIADRVGSPTAVRATGAAVGRNPVSIVVPCHRVLGRDGSLTGYAGGLHRKRALLALEGILVP
jgi:methylated-DNA-[protein]-cysteine S-methyltransferase